MEPGCVERVDEIMDGVNGPADALGIVQQDSAESVEPFPAVLHVLAEGVVGALLQMLNRMPVGCRLCAHSANW